MLDRDVCVKCYEHSRVVEAPPELRTKLIELTRKCRFRTELFVESYELIYGDSDPYANLKKDLNRAVIEILNEVFEPSLATVMALSAAGNAVDIATPWYPGFDLVKELRKAKSLVVSEVHRVARLFERSSSIAVLMDNAGEAVIDVALAYALALKGKRVFLIARSLPYETDVTCSEVAELIDVVGNELGLSEAISNMISVVCTGSRYPAPARGFVDSRIDALLRGVDAVLSKGIANLEAFLEFGFEDPSKVAVVLKAKCLPIAKLFRKEFGSMIVAVLDEVTHRAMG